MGAALAILLACAVIGARAALVETEPGEHVFERDVHAASDFVVGGSLSVGGGVVCASGLSVDGDVSADSVELGGPAEAALVDLPTTVLPVHPPSVAYDVCGPAQAGVISFHPQQKEPIVCDGQLWRLVSTNEPARAISASYGNSAAEPGRSCWDIKRNRAGSLSDGVYWIELTGGPRELYCDMTSDADAWTLVFKETQTPPQLTQGMRDEQNAIVLNATGGAGNGKLSDADINSVKAFRDERATFRATTPDGSLAVYFPGTCEYMHDRAAWNAAPAGVRDACMRFSATAALGSVPTYIQCEDWPGSAGLNAWMGCGAEIATTATNVVITIRVGALSNSAITGNPTGQPLGTSIANYNDPVLVWVH